MLDQKSHLIRESADGVVTVTMNRPEKRNALSLELMGELTDAFREVGADRENRVVILRGEGRAFSAGHDLREMLNRSPEDYQRIFDVCIQLMDTIQAIPQPVIAEVAGIATAAGCQLVATCDLAVAADEARFATAGVKVGLFCATPMVALTRAVGRKRAMEMLLIGDEIDAKTACDCGLVNYVVPRSELSAKTHELAKRIAALSGFVIGLGKAAFYAADRDQAKAYEHAKAIMVRNALADDGQEGMSAFVEKRPARWKQ
ncbi:MAG: enoyl-CoA hydratase [Candidatus Eremiobacteraeota bacterium]|nr:enoyl-CoA hydratase [Candidatus Eremiobacteraeota bacterium]